MFPLDQHQSMPHWHQGVVHVACARLGPTRVTCGSKVVKNDSKGVPRPVEMLQQAVFARFELVVTYFGPL